MATNSTNQEKRQNYVEIGKLAAGLFHDLINPLSAIILNLEEALNNNGLNKIEKNDYYREALKASYCINQFINDVNCQIEQKKIVEFFNLQEAINSSKTLFKYQLLKNNIELLTEVATDIKLIGPKNRLCRIINNLLSNAIRACREKKLNKKAIIKIKAQISRNYLEIKVIDNGCGVSPKIRAKLFDEFSSTKSNQANLSGFGLYSAQRMVKNDFKGKIVYKQVKVGSIFIVKIPKKLVKTCEKQVKIN